MFFLFPMRSFCIEDFYQKRRNLLNWYHAVTEYIPLVSIVLHYGIVVNIASECENTNTFHIEYAIYMCLHILVIFVSHLFALVSEHSNPVMTRREWAIAVWKSLLTVLQFFNFTYIRAKPYKCIFGDDYDPVSATFMFWSIHLFTIANVFILKNYIPNDIRTFELMLGPALLENS